MCSLPFSLPFVRFAALLLSCCLQIWLYLAFNGFLTGFYGCRVGLYYLRALRGLWGFCVREWLGGFGACCVFCLLFSLFVLLSCSPAWLPALPAFLLFVLISWLCGLAFSVGWVVGFLSLSDGFRYKKKGRSVLVRPLLPCCSFVYMFSAFLSVASFVFENIHPAPQVR